MSNNDTINSHLTDSELPKAEEINDDLTPEELEFIATAECQESNNNENNKKVFSMSKGAVGAAVVGNTP